MIDGLIKLQNSSVTQPVNLGNPQEHTIKQIAEIILQLTKSTSNICYNDLPKDDPQRRRPDISQANELLDWLPAISLEQGLLKTIEYFVR